jgi:hypothetical protein
MTELSIEQKAQNAADALGISFYVRDGRIWQNGPGQEIRPREGAKPIPHEPAPALPLGAPEPPAG